MCINDINPNAIGGGSPNIAERARLGCQFARRSLAAGREDGAFCA